MSNLKEGRQREYVGYVPLANKIGDFSELKVRVEYAKGGINYFSGGYNKRGYRVSLKPVSRGNGIESSIMLGSGKESGGYIFIEETNRYNARRLREIAVLLDERIPEFVKAYEESNNEKLIELAKI